MAVVKTYNVVVNVGVNTRDTAKGNAELKRNLQSYEREVLESQKRIHREEQRFADDRRKREQIITQNNQDEATRRFNARQADFQRQLNQSAEHYTKTNNIAEQMRQNEIKATKDHWREKLRVHAEGEGARIKQMQQTAELERKLQAASPFHNERFTQQSARNAGFSARTFETQQFDKGIRTLDPFQKAHNISLKQASKDIADFDAQTRKSTQGMGMWGQAFKGAFIGAIAGMTFATIISGLTQFISLMAQGVIESVKLAGNLELTTNALAAFTGSTRSAKKELQEMDELAQNTPGLRMVAAREGFQQLRALGFEAKQAKAFIKELGEEKILSGASDEALQKIIFNFAQIASGGQKVSQELREILTQMPSMRNAFFDAFGTLDPKKIQVFFDKNNDEAFKKLTDAMASQRAAAGGLNDAWGKAGDAFIKAGEEIGKPFLQPITRDLKALTQYIKENADAWKQFGQDLADVYNGLSQIAQLTAGEDSLISWFIWGAERNADAATGGFYSSLKNTVVLLKEIGKQRREMEEFNRASPRDKTRLQAKSILGTAFSSVLPSDEDIQASMDEAKVALLNTERDLVELTDRATKQRLEVIRDFNTEKISIIESANRRELAIIDAQITDTVEQEIELANKRTQIVNKGLREQYKEYEAFYAEMIDLNVGNDVEVQRLAFERNQKLRGISDQIFENELRRQKEVAEKERQILETRRQAQIEFTNKSIEISKFRYDTAISDIERGIERETVSIETGYSQIEGIVKASYDEQIRLSREAYELQLQDKKLTVEQRANLEREMYFTEEKLAEESRQKVLEIEQKKREGQIRQINEYHDQVRDKLDALANYYTSFAQSIDFSRITKDTVKELGLSLFGGDPAEIKADYEAKNQQQKEYQARILERLRVEKLSSQQIDELRSNYDNANTVIDENNKKITLLETGYSALSKTIFEITKGYQNGTKSLEEFQAMQLKVFDAETLVGVQKYKNEIERLDELIPKASSATERKGLEQRRDRLVDEKELFIFTRSVEKAELYRSTLQGINEEIAKLKSGDKDTERNITDAARIQLKLDERDTLIEIKRLEYELANPDLNAENERKIAILEKLLDVRNREADALTRIKLAEIEIAEKGKYSPNQDRAAVLEFLAQQKGITEIISDAKINAITTAYQGLDRVAQSLAKNFGFAADAVQQLISSLLKLALNKIFQKLFGVNADGTGRNFSLGNVSQTPNYNPSATTSPGGAVTEYFNQILGGGGSNSSIPPVSVPPDLLPQGNVGLHEGAHAQGIFGKGKFNLQSGMALGSVGLMALGSLIGGIGGSSLSGAGLGMSLGMAIGSIIPGLGTVVGGLVGAGVGAIAGLLGGIFGRNARRRKEEKLRNTAMADAFRQLDKLIEDVNADRIDGASAVEQAEQIRANYVEQMSQLKDKKTRSHALKDVSRIDAKISELKTAVAGQKSRRERLELFAPTFADGGTVSGFGRSSFRNNPLGYQQGGRGTNRSDSMLGYFPSSRSYARFSNSEYILDAETTSRIGVHNLDLMRQTKGESFNSMLARTQGRAFGGAVGQTMTPIANVPNAQTSNQPIEVHLHIDGSVMSQVIAQAISIAIKSNDGSTSQMNELKKSIENEGQNGLVQAIADAVKPLLNIR